MKFKFETGEIIEVFDESIARILRSDKRYEEVKETPKKEKPKKSEPEKGDE